MSSNDDNNPTTPSSTVTPSNNGKDRNLPSPEPMHPPLPPPKISENHTSETTSLLRGSETLPPPFPDDEDEWAMPTRSMVRLIGLTIIMAGIQVAWSVEFSYISPYLLSLGLPKATLSLIWMAGPISGVVVQPVIGMLSDRCDFKWGRRRIFIVLSTIGTVIGFIGMGRTKEIIRWWTGRREWDVIRDAVVALAIVSLIMLDLSINASIFLDDGADVATAAARALIVDWVPTAQQNSANAWAGRMLGIGNVIGYLSGYINLPDNVPFLGETQFQILCVLAPAFFVFAAAITCVMVQEIDPALLFTLPGQEHEDKGLKAAFRFLTSIARLPHRIRQICNVQFFAFIGWFLCIPLLHLADIVLIWNTTYTGEIYVAHYLEKNLPPPNRHEEDRMWDNATRIASFALLLESFISLIANFFLPLLLKGHFAVPGMTLRRFWIASHLWFAALMWSTFFISTVEAAVAMVACAGISWALTLWAPFALIAQCVSHIHDISRRESLASSRSGTPDLRPVDSSYGSVRQNSDRVAPHTGISITEERRPSISTPVLAPQPARPQIPSLISSPPPSPQKLAEEKEITSAGAIMGLHNVFISSPQFISTLLASLIFHFLGAGGRGDGIGPNSVGDEAGGGGSAVGSNSIAWVLRVGGLGGLVAAYLAWRLKEESDEIGD